ncbi:hypothetical protein [Streptomyces bobili]
MLKTGAKRDLAVQAAGMEPTLITGLCTLGGAAFGSAVTFAGGYLSRREDRRTRHVDAQRTALIDFLKAVRGLRASIVPEHEADDALAAVSAAWLELSVLVPPSLREQTETLYRLSGKLDGHLRVMNEHQRVLRFVDALAGMEMDFDAPAAPGSRAEDPPNAYEGAHDLLEALYDYVDEGKGEKELLKKHMGRFKAVFPQERRRTGRPGPVAPIWAAPPLSRW